METKRESLFIGAGTPYDNQTFSMEKQIHKRKSDMNLKEQMLNNILHILFYIVKQICKIERL